jgi:hypothetical protein
MRRSLFSSRTSRQYAPAIEKADADRPNDPRSPRALRQRVGQEQAAIWMIPIRFSLSSSRLGRGRVSTNTSHS